MHILHHVIFCMPRMSCITFCILHCISHFKFRILHCISLLNFLRDFGNQFFVRPNTENESSENRGHENRILSRIGKVIVYERFLGKVDDKGYRVKQDELMIFCRQSRQWINYGRSIHYYHQKHVPYHGKIPEFHV